jgi:hypothetical protein
MLPNRFAREEATSIERAEVILVTKKMDPSLPSSMPKRQRKKYVTQDLKCQPLA